LGNPNVAKRTKKGSKRKKFLRKEGVEACPFVGVLSLVYI